MRVYILSILKALGLSQSTDQKKKKIKETLRYKTFPSTQEAKVGRSFVSSRPGRAM